MKKTSKSTKLPCAFCQGRGTQPGAGSLSCIVCKGRGRVTLKQPYSICKECGGRGKKAGANLYCWQCHGKGFVASSVSKTRSSNVPTLRRESEFQSRRLKSALSIEASEPQRRKKKSKKRKDKLNKRKSYKLVELKKRGKKSVALPAGPEYSNRSRQAKVRKEKVIVKKERKSFFKKLFSAIKIL